MPINQFPVSWPQFSRYAAALALFLVALLLRFLILPVDGGLAFVTLYPAIIGAFYFFGAGCGTLVAILSGLAGEYFFVPPYFQWPTDLVQYRGLAFFAVTSTLIGLTITTLHRNAAGLADSIAKSQQREKLLQLLESLARATAESASAENGLRACIERICDYGDWPLGHAGIYAPGQTSGEEYLSLWQTRLPQQFEEFKRYSMTFLHSNPTGQFVSVAMRERRPVWVEDLQLTKSFGRLGKAQEYGIRAGFVFPVLAGEGALGFIEFFDTKVRTPDQPLLDSIGSVAGQLARLIERSHAQAALETFNAELEARVESRTAELEVANRELNEFSYTVAHDLRAPLRAVNGYSEILLKNAAPALDARSAELLARLADASRRMGELIDDLLEMSRLSRQEMQRQEVDLSDLARQAVADLHAAAPERTTSVSIKPGMRANADSGLIRAVIDNLVGNAWKFTAKTPAATIVIGTESRDGREVFFVRDNGAGFEMQYAHKLFAPFQRLHETEQFEGTGIGLATVKKIIERHRGNVWAESTVGAGTTIYFTLGA